MYPWISRRVDKRTFAKKIVAIFRVGQLKFIINRIFAKLNMASNLKVITRDRKMLQMQLNFEK